MNGVSTIYTSLWGYVAVPIIAAEQPIIAALQGWLAGWFVVAVTAYLMAMLLIAAYSPGEEGITRFFRQLMLAGVVYSLAVSASGFNYYVSSAAAGLVTSITNAITGILGAGAPTTAGSFDLILAKLFAYGLAGWNGMSWYSPKSYMLGIVVIIYWLLMFVTMTAMFVVYMISSIILGFVIAFGPAFIMCYLFPLARQFFDGWLRVVVAAIVTQIFMVSIFILFVTTINAIVASTQIGAASPTASQPGGDTINQVFTLLAMIPDGAIFLFLVFYLSRLAQSIAGGAHAQFARIPKQLNPFSGGSGAPHGGGGPSGGNSGSSGGFGGAPGGGAPPRQYAFTRSVGSAS